MLAYYPGAKAIVAGFSAEMMRAGGCQRGHVSVVDGPAFGTADAGAFRLSFATPQPILTEIVRPITAALAP
jgi:bifunctional pyridoxal-dependent enzyme with beta-cystathionase and maltose regulon repressor activities